MSVSSRWEGRGRGHVEGRTWRPPPLSFVGIERVVFEETTITSSATSCGNGTEGRGDDGDVSEVGREECREERGATRARLVRARAGSHHDVLVVREHRAARRETRAL